MNGLRLFIFAALLPLTTYLIAAPQSEPIPAPILKSLDNNKVEPTALSLAAIPLTGKGKPLFINANTAVNPASTMKVFTTYAALELLGPNYRWRTTFFTDGDIKNGVLEGNLYLKGSGDPNLGMERLWLLLRDLRNNGITTIKGNLILDRSYFKIPKTDSFDDDSNQPYRPYLVTPDDLLINLKVIKVFILTEDDKANIVIDPPLRGIDVNHQVQVVQPRVKGRCPAIPDIKYQPQVKANGTIELTIKGTIVNDCQVQRYLSLFNHDQYVIAIVRAIWQELGGKITGGNQLGLTPKDAKVLAVTYSPDLVTIIRDINKYSNNTMAKQVFLTIGARNRKPTDKDDAKSAYHAIVQLLSQKGMISDELVIENGSGLSRNERITPREMVSLLNFAWQSIYSAEFIASMPIIGIDGTMHKRLKKTPLKGKGHIKTGSLKDVRAIAGYIRDKHNDIWAVTAILNHPKPWGTTEVLDDILLYLYDPTVKDLRTLKSN